MGAVHSLVLICSLLHTASAYRCGDANIKGKISSNTDLTSYWTVILRKKSVINPRECLGTLVDFDEFNTNSNYSSIVVTASTCIREKLEFKKWTVYTGIGSSKELRNAYPVEFGIAFTESSDVKSVREGITVLRVRKPIVFDKYTRSVCLSSAELKFAKNAQCYMVIFKKKFSGATHMPLSILSETECMKMDKRLGNAKIYCGTVESPELPHTMKGSPLLCVVNSIVYQYGVYTKNWKRTGNLRSGFKNHLFTKFKVKSQKSMEETIVGFNDLTRYIITASTSPDVADIFKKLKSNSTLRARITASASFIQTFTSKDSKKSGSVESYPISEVWSDSTEDRLDKFDSDELLGEHTVQAGIKVEPTIRPQPVPPTEALELRESFDEDTIHPKQKLQFPPSPEQLEVEKSTKQPVSNPEPLSTESVAAKDGCNFYDPEKSPQHLQEQCLEEQYPENLYNYTKKEFFKTHKHVDGKKIKRYPSEVPTMRSVHIYDITKSTKVPLCTGNLYVEKNTKQIGFVITAASCVQDSSETSTYRVYVAPKGTESRGRWLIIDKLAREEPSFSTASMGVAVLRLSKPIQMKTSTENFVLSESFQDIELKQQRCFMSGICPHGKSAFTPVTILTDEECKSRIKGSFDPLTEFCALTKKDALIEPTGAALSCRYNESWMLHAMYKRDEEAELSEIVAPEMTESFQIAVFQKLLQGARPIKKLLSSVE